MTISGRLPKQRRRGHLRAGAQRKGHRPDGLSVYRRRGEFRGFPADADCVSVRDHQRRFGNQLQPERTLFASGGGGHAHPRLQSTEQRVDPGGHRRGVDQFSDRASVSGYAVSSLNASVELEFFSGYSDGTLMPRANITNEQTAKIVWEMKLKAEMPGLQWG